VLSTSSLFIMTHYLNCGSYVMEAQGRSTFGSRIFCPMQVCQYQFALSRSPNASSPAMQVCQLQTHLITNYELIELRSCRTRINEGETSPAGLRRGNMLWGLVGSDRLG